MSQLSDELGGASSVFYHWQREFFENGPFGGALTRAMRLRRHP